MDMYDEANRFVYVLEQLCKDVGKGRIKCPVPEDLTSALVGLFEERNGKRKYIPEGTLVAVRDVHKAYYYIDSERVPIPPCNRPDIKDLQRILTSYIRD